jgi:ATP-dependent RNA helicase DDX46/PRP5
MQKRRERIERWRAERKKKELDATKKDGKSTMLANLQLPTAKKWSLEDDSDEEPPIILNKDVKEENIKEENEEEKVEIKKEDEEEIDPLDAFMAEVQEEVRKVNKIDNKAVKPGTFIKAYIHKQYTIIYICSITNFNFYFNLLYN